MAEKMMLTEDQAIELFVFLITSARTQLDDPCLYASMRLLTAAELLRDFVTEHSSPNLQNLYRPCSPPEAASNARQKESDLAKFNPLGTF